EDNSDVYNIVGVLSTGSQTTVGISIVVNAIDRDTQAYVGQASDQAAGTAATTLTSGGRVEVNAKNAAKDFALSLAGSLASKKEVTSPKAGYVKPDSSFMAFWDSARGNDTVTKPAPLKDQASKSIAGAGAVSINVVHDNARAYINNPAIIAAAALAVRADNQTILSSNAGALAISKGSKKGNNTGIAGSIGINIVTGTTQAFVEGAVDVTLGSLDVRANRGGYIGALTAGAAGAAGGCGDRRRQCDVRHTSPVVRGAPETSADLCNREQPQLPHSQGAAGVHALHRSIHRHGHPRSRDRLHRACTVDGREGAARHRPRGNRARAARGVAVGRTAFDRGHGCRWFRQLVSRIINSLKKRRRESAPYGVANARKPSRLAVLCALSGDDFDAFLFLTLMIEQMIVQRTNDSGH
ncbi:MAG: hypothetical protein NT123_10530, partial [Proteobacteria bacterium]|nr:hypothetical protein [Pseudomonadota bacterium]